MSESSERRSRRKLLAQEYNRLPSREMLIAEAELERMKMQRASQNEQAAMQKGSLAVAVLSQIPRDNEENKPIFAEARTLLHDILRQGIERLNAAEAEEDDDDETDGAPETT